MFHLDLKYGKITQQRILGGNKMIPVQSGTPPILGNLFTFASAAFTIIVPIALLILLVWYLKKEMSYRKQILERLDNFIHILQIKNTDDK